MSNNLINSRERIDDKNWLLEREVNSAITAILSSLGQMKLEYNVHAQAVREFSQAFSMVLSSYREGKISYGMAHDLIIKIKVGFVEGSRSLRNIERNRKVRNEQRAEQKSRQYGIDTSYRRNMRINNQSFNVRFMASCATTECLMRNANIDMEDDAFQDYIAAAIQDKRSDAINAISLILIVNPYLKALERVIYVDMGVSVMDGNLNSVWAFVMGKGVAYRLKLLNLHERTWKMAENATSYTTGGVLENDK